MYKPAPRRPKKTSIVRTRTGCITCRERRKKVCDEKKPACSTCVRLGKRCENYKTGFNFRNVSFVTTQTEARITRSRASSPEYDACLTPLSFKSPKSAIADITTPPNSDTDAAGQNTVTRSTTPSDHTVSLQDSPVSLDTAQDSLGNVLLDNGSAVWSGHLEDGTLRSATEQPGWMQLSPSTFLRCISPIDDARQNTEGEQGCLEDLPDTDTEMPLSLDHALQNILGPQMDHGLDEDAARALNTASNSLTGYNSTTSEELAALSILVPYNKVPRQPSFFSVPGQSLEYTEFWDSQCLPALHPIFKQFPALGYLPRVVTDTMMALSAGRMSRLLPQRKSLQVLSASGLSFRPDMSHKTSSQKYYCSAISGISGWVQQSNASDPVLTLTVLILFCYWESSMGNFRDFAIHSGAATTLIQSQRGTLVQQSPIGYGLMAAWLRAWMNNWWRRMHFSTPDFQRKQAPVSINPDVDAILDMAGDSKASVLVILCESLRIYSSAVVDFWDLFGHSPASVDEASGFFEAQPNPFMVNGACVVPYTLLMRTQCSKLSKWHTKVPLCELPITSFHSTAGAMVMEDISLTVEALCFQSHDAAMNYAYYITARIIQSADLVRNQPSKAPTSAHDDPGQWTHILLRIAAGIDWRQCIRLNTYTIGFSGLLLVCAIHSPSLAVGLWIQDWLEEREKTSHFEEGSFPVLQILQVLRAVNRERAIGRDVLAVFQAVDDGGGEGKFHSYHSQTLTAVVVYGRNSWTGEAICYTLPV
ncbi:hypothetical protein FZEAL_3470 [Fusarium zealandicum]|uniref:Zn(2)-C6 fungal-type domain-containing protein n=1 Tax=Fusarium zealandicum TaxID=1053134 RepID=A0A8H4XME6_9HYPO|nr:hypothetical protein FZEAL_3470 [Fusarium zealandicum]